MALVVFGIGGLMRFRTDVGPAKDTGRVILTAVVGVCCGLKLLVVAVTATAFGWLLLWMLERDTFTRLLVKGVPAEGLRRRPRPTALLLAVRLPDAGRAQEGARRPDRLRLRRARCVRSRALRATGAGIRSRRTCAAPSTGTSAKSTRSEHLTHGFLGVVMSGGRP